MQAYVAWTNSQLKKLPNGKVVEDLARDMQDGVALSQLIEVVGRLHNNLFILFIWIYLFIWQKMLGAASYVPVQIKTNSLDIEI